MSAAPATKARRINEILLELGFATEEAMAKATIEQEKTGQPLGQILVDHGVITRLELASALAEQWSDQSASIKILPIPSAGSGPRRAPEPHHDDDQYAARLQDAVAELAQRVGAGAAQPTEEFDDRVTDLAERVEATVARTQRIEATLATLAESFEGVTGGVEEAFGALQAGMAGLAFDLARIDTTVAELGAGTSEALGADPALVARLEELGSAVAVLAARPAADPAIEGHLDALAARVESLAEATEVNDIRTSLTAIAEKVAALAERPVADPTAIDARLEALAARVENIVTPDEVVALHESLVAFEQRLAVLAEDAGSTAALDEQARSLAELRETVVELERRPVGDPDLDDRLARIETQFAERLAAKLDSGEIEGLVARIEERSDEHESLSTSVAQLGVRIDEMTWRDDGAAVRIEELQQHVESVAADLTDVRESLAAQEAPGALPQLAELGQSLAAMHDEVATLAQSIRPADEMEQIGQRLDDLAAAHDAQHALAVRLGAIESRIATDLVTPQDLSQALVGAREELTPAAAPMPDPRVDRLAEEITEVRARLAEVSATPESVTDPALQEQIQELASRIEQLAGAREQGASLAAKLEALEQSLAAPTTADPRVGQLAHDIAVLREQLAKAERPPTADPVVASELDTLSQRLRYMDERINGDMATTTEVARALDALRAELASSGTTGSADTSELEGTLGALVTRVDGLAEAVSTVAPSAAGPAAEELQRLIDERVEAQVAERVADLTRELEGRLAAAESLPRSPGATGVDGSSLDDLLERNRMTIERLGLHLGEHDRALAELMRTRNLPARLDELAARVEELAAGAPAGGAQASGTRREVGSIGSSEPSFGEVKALMRRVEDAEVASEADREKMMNRLERMASSIDWRLQRLEAAETDTPSTDDD